MKAENYNQYPESLKKWLDEYFKKKPKVTFELASIKPDPDFPDKLLIPSHYEFPLTDLITWKDPEGKDKETHTLSIAYIKNVASDGSITIGEAVFEDERGGKIRCNAEKIPEQRRLATFMLLSNHNLSNPQRSPEARGIYKVIDLQEQAREERATRKVQRRAIQILDDMTDANVREMFSILYPGSNINAIESFEEVSNQVEKKAFADPKAFIAAAEAIQNTFEVLAREAASLGVIANRQKISTFVFAENDEPILEYSNMKTCYAELADFLNKNPEITNVIQTKVDIVKKETSS